MPSNWNKGFTKNTHPSVRKISETMKRRKIDNFAVWREAMKKEGKIQSTYPSFQKNGDLAELIGVTLGDGHICVYPRTEELRIITNSNNLGFIKRYAGLIKKVFEKKPYIIANRFVHSTKIGLYQKLISKRIGIASGARKNLTIVVPRWILKKQEYVRRYLRGLYEAEGSFCVHKPTYTYKFLFSNKNQSLLDTVYQLMRTLGFHPHKSRYQVQISKKKEAYTAVKVLGFRDYKSIAG